MTSDDLFRLWSQAGGTFTDDAPDRPATMQISEAHMLQFFTLMREQMAYEGWRQCAQGQKTTQFCAVAEQERSRACRIVTGLCISDNNAREINEAICAQGQRTTQFCAVAEQARLEEREACAKVCDPYTHGQWFAAAIRAQAADRLARHGISIPEDEEYGNPSF